MMSLYTTVCAALNDHLHATAGKNTSAMLILSASQHPRKPWTTTAEVLYTVKRDSTSTWHKAIVTVDACESAEHGYIWSAVNIVKDYV